MMVWAKSVVAFSGFEAVKDVCFAFDHSISTLGFGLISTATIIL